MNNREIYDKVRTVPNEAKKTISGGKLNGFTDINPMWRIKTLTSVFGPCGFGWYYEIVKKWIEPAPDGRVAAYVDINLYVKYEGEWSKPIPGTGGSMFVDLEKGSPRASDECYKMALTDAISVACKALGVGADVYWEKDRTKYDTNDLGQDAPTKQNSKPMVCHDCGKDIKNARLSNGAIVTVAEILEHSKKYNLPLCYKCLKERMKQDVTSSG